MVKTNNRGAKASEVADFEDATHSYSLSGPRRKSDKDLDPLAQILETLYSEHRYISSLLDKLESEAEKLKPGKIPDFHLLLNIVDYLTHYPGRYHHPREDMLFSILLKQSSKFQKQLDRLGKDHEILAQLNAVLFNQLTTVVKGDKVNRNTLLTRINAYLLRYRKHIKFESEQIFPLAKGDLTAAELRKLQIKTRFIDDPLFGGELGYNYHRLGRNLSYEIGAESSRLAVAEMHYIEKLIRGLSDAMSRSKVLRQTIGEHRKNALQEQLDTCRESLQAGFSAKLLFLPLELGKNHTRQAKNGWQDIRAVLTGQDTESGPQSRAASK